jgi:hypothetical protein
MGIPVWAVGQVLSASDVNSWFVPLVAVKPSDTARSLTTSVTNDPDLQLSLAANAIYDVTAAIQYKGGANGSTDGQCTLNAPSGATGFWFAHRLQISSLTLSSLTVAFSTNANIGTNGTGNPEPLFIKASVTTSTAGTLAFAWAQNMSSNTATTMMAGSLISAQRIG